VAISLLIVFDASSQQKTIDSLEQELIKPTNGLSTLEVLNELSWYYALSNPSKGIEIANEAIDLAINENDSLKLGIAYERIGFYYQKLGKDSLVLSSYKLAEEAYKKIHHKERLAALAFNLGNFHLFRSNYRESLKQGQKALQLFESNKDSLKIARVCNQMGLNHIYLGSYAIALETFQKGLLLLELSHKEESSFYAEILGNMGLLYEKLSEYENASQFQKKALQIHIKNSYNDGIANTYNNLGKLYGILDQHEKALEMFNASYEIKKEMGNEYRIANAYTNIGLTYHALNKLDDALNQFNMAKSVYKKLKHNTNLSTVHKSIGDIYLDKALAKKAIKHFDSAFVYANTADDKRAAYLAKEGLAEANFKTANYETAYQLQQEALALKEYLLSNENRDELANLKATYKYEKEKALLEADFEKNKAIDLLEIKQQTFKKNVSIGIGVFSLILLVIGFSLYRRKKEADLNAQIVTSELQKLKAQMNPHFVFNTLNSINDYVLKNDKDNASNYLVRFSEMMRRILDNSNKDEISLEEEVNFLDTYIRLEQQRLNNAFDYTITIDETIDVEDTFVPPSLLQPFIENSIWHGLSNKKKGGHLNVMVTKEANVLVCTVDDNGVGIQPKNDSFKNQKAFGSSSIRDRINLLNKLKGTDATVEYIKKDQGVCAVIRLPLVLDT